MIEKHTNNVAYDPDEANKIIISQDVLLRDRKYFAIRDRK